MKRLIMILILIVTISIAIVTTVKADDSKLKMFDFFPDNNTVYTDKNISTFKVDDNPEYKYITLDSNNDNDLFGIMFVSRTNINYNSQNIPTTYETLEIWKFVYDAEKKFSGMLGFIAWGELDQLADLDSINKEVTYLYKTGDFLVGHGYRIEGLNRNFITVPICIKSDLFNESWTIEGVFEPCIGLNAPGKLEGRNIAFLPKNNADFKVGLGGQFQVGPDSSGYHIVRILFRTGNDPMFDLGIGEMNPFSNDSSSTQIYIRVLILK